MILIADVAGHSIGSALLMAMARSVLRREVAQGHSPADRARRHQRGDAPRPGQRRAVHHHVLRPLRPGTQGASTYANAGHNPPIVASASGETLELDADGAAIGFLEDGRRSRSSRSTSAPGDRTAVLHRRRGRGPGQPATSRSARTGSAETVAAMAPAGAKATIDTIVDALNDFTRRRASARRHHDGRAGGAGVMARFGRTAAPAAERSTRLLGALSGQSEYRARLDEALDVVKEISRPARRLPLRRRTRRAALPPRAHAGAPGRRSDARGPRAAADGDGGRRGVERADAPVRDRPHRRTTQRRGGDQPGRPAALPPRDGGRGRRADRADPRRYPSPRKTSRAA